MASRARTAALLSVVVIALSGCAMLGPQRGPDGRVTEPTDIRSTELIVGDCFSFVEGTNMVEATVVPCELEHTYLVIGQGTLSQDEIDEAGGLQNAVSASCSEAFAAYVATVAEGDKPTQEFIVSTVEEDGEQVTRYSCVTTNSAA